MIFFRSGNFFLGFGLRSLALLTRPASARENFSSLLSAFGFRISNLALALLASLLLVLPASAQEKWTVPGAQMRFKVEVDSRPNTPDAGIIVTFPNGGALPGPFPNAVVIDSAGQQVRSECLWNNPKEGCAFVFPSPAADGPLRIYIEGSSSPSNPWTADSALHPSLLLYTRVGNASLSEARNLANEQPPGEGVRMGQVPMIADAQNRFGPSEDFISYYTGWLDCPEAGEYFFGTISQDGSTVLIDGKTAANWPGMHSFKEGLTGTKGGTITLTQGQHRVEYFQFTSEGSPRSQLIWRTPSMKKSDLPKTPKDFARSGSARIVGAESRQGAPPALFNRRAVSYMDFANQFVDLYELSVPLSDQYNGATFDWTFSDGFHAQGSHLLWPVVRGVPLSVTLTVTGRGGTSSSTRLLYLDMLPPGAKVDDLSARRDYAQALLNRLEGAPAGSSPAASWPPAFWQMLPQVVQGGEAKDLLAFLFQHCGADLGNLNPDDQKRLGDIYYEELKEDKAGAPAILNGIIKGERDPAAQFHWQLKALDFELFEVGDIATARQIAAALRVDPFHGGKDDAELKLIAMGDVERMAGNIPLATQYYTAAQTMYEKAARTPFAGFAGFSDPMGAPTPAPNPQANGGIVIGAADTQDADWRKRAVLQNSYYTEVKNLIDQDELGDARDKLDAWAIEFPLSKLGGDHAMAEAEYALKFDDFERAQRILKSYRLRVDLSPQLAEAMQMEWDCDAELQRPADIKELAADIKKRFPDLPLAKAADKALNGQMPAPLVGRTRPPDLP
jgi:TolA-binding protein